MLPFFDMDKRKRNAFTVVEIVIVMGIIAILFSLSVPQLFRLQDRTTLRSATVTLISHMRQQQSNAMNSSSLYGIFFEQGRYILFTGSHYTSSAPELNTVVSLDYPVAFSQILFPTSEVVFASGSGEIVDYDTINHSVALQDSINNQEKKIEFNAFGVPISIQ